MRYANNFNAAQSGVRPTFIDADCSLDGFINMLTKIVVGLKRRIIIGSPSVFRMVSSVESHTRNNTDIVYYQLFKTVLIGGERIGSGLEVTNEYFAVRIRFDLRYFLRSNSSNSYILNTLFTTIIP